MSKIFYNLIDSDPIIIEETSSKISDKGEKLYQVDDDCDFGSIEPKDLILEMHINSLKNPPGIILVESL